MESKIKDLSEVREVIDTLDRELARIFEKRMKCVVDVARYKKANNMKVLDKKREEEVIEKNLNYLEDESLREPYRELLEDMMGISKRYQRDLLNQGDRIGYQGVEGSFSYSTLKDIYPENENKNYESFEDVFKGVVDGEVEVGILPMENSSTGDIGEVYDLLRKYNLYIVGKYNLKISQNLLGVKGSSIEDIEEVYSHPQGFKQSREFLDGYNWKCIDFANTAVSAKYVRDSNTSKKGAIGSVEAGELYDLEILKRDINTASNNTTKFVLISKKPKEEGELISLLISTKHKKGELYKALGVIEECNFNMHIITSRPAKDVPWEYYFYIELDGSKEREEELLSKLGKVCNLVKPLGRYNYLKD